LATSPGKEKLISSADTWLVDTSQLVF